MVEKSIAERINLMLANHDVGVVIPNGSGLEAYAAGLGLGLGLGSLASKSRVYFEGDLNTEESELLSKLPGQELVIHTPPNSEFEIAVSGLPNSNVQNVGYFNQGEELHILVSTDSPLQKELSSRVIQSTNDWEVCIILATEVVSLLNLQNLITRLPGEKIVLTNAQLPSQVTLISDTKAKNMSQLVFGFMGVMGIYPTLESATCLMYGLGVTRG